METVEICSDIKLVKTRQFKRTLQRYHLAQLKEFDQVPDINLNNIYFNKVRDVFTVCVFVCFYLQRWRAAVVSEKLCTKHTESDWRLMRKLIEWRFLPWVHEVYTGLVN